MEQKNIEKIVLNHYTAYKSSDMLHNSNGALKQRITCFIMGTSISSDGFTKFLLYDTDGTPVMDFYEYINFTLRDRSFSYRKAIAYALKRLYECMDIYDVRFDEITYEFIAVLRSFMIGNIVFNRTNGLNKNSAETEIGFCKEYISTLGYTIKKSKSCMFETKTTNYKGTGVSLANTSLFVPKYITDKEFIRLIVAMKDNPRVLYTKKYLSLYKENAKEIIDSETASLLGLDLFGECSDSKLPEADIESILIVTLMFTCGLRIGEVLGLTTEDIVKEKDKYFLLLRNRLSDMPGQYAKNLTHPSTAEDYKKSWYHKESGCSKVEISKSVYECIMTYKNNLLDKYIELIHSPDLDADCVDEGTLTNHYLFMNTAGDRMSSMTWNTVLRSYFDKAQIPRDKDIKSSNLNHRFRHSYAVRLATMFRNANKANPDNPPFGVADLARALRHKSLDTCFRYFSWTDEQASAILEDFSGRFVAEFPEVMDVFGVLNDKNIE